MPNKVYKLFVQKTLGRVNKMKKIILTLACLTISLFAAEESGKYYVGFNSGVVNSMDDGYFGGSEDLSNVVGNSGIRNEIELGFKKDFNNRNDLYSNVFLYAWQNDASKNAELGFGLGGKLGWKSDNNSLTFGAKGGIGTQRTSGDTFTTNTSYTNVSYATLGAQGLPQTAVFIENTEVIEMGLLLGYAYQLTSNISFNAGVEYIYSNYQFAYHIPSGNVTLSGVTQDTLYFNAGLKYSF
ncbi:MAG: hypothetical protein WC656_09080 [Sulfurimonas sp.]